MSTKAQTIIIAPPSTSYKKQEKIIVNHIRCGVCYGNGFFWTENAVGERVKAPCEYCNGTGEVKGRITIDWSSEDKQQ